jgi:hypothetical protein
MFGMEGSGKTRLCASAGEWARDHGKIPGWLVMDRKTRKTVREVCQELGLDAPYVNEHDFISQKDALGLATNEKFDEVQKTYTAAIRKLFDAAVQLGSMDGVEPIVFDSGTQLWDWIAFSHFGRKQDVGKSRVWGPPKQDWTDLMDALSHKTVLITLRARDEYKNDARTGKLMPDGPPHLGFTTTTIVRMTQRDGKLSSGESFVDRFGMDVWQSQDNVALEGEDNVLTGSAITYSNLLMQLRPEEA